MAPFNAAQVTLTAGPDRVPVEVRATFDSLSDDDFRRIRDALTVKYGVPYKSTPRHLVLRLNGDFFVLRRTAAGGATVAAINTAAQKAMKAREAAAEQARFDEETAGL